METRAAEPKARIKRNLWIAALKPSYSSAKGRCNSESVVPDQFTNAITDAIARGWANFIARPAGPLSFRFYLQPAIGIIMALRAGLKDAREDRPAYLWKTFTNPDHRGALL